MNQGVSVKALAVGDGRVTGVMTDKNNLYADDVVLAVGVAIPDLLRGVGIKFALDRPEGLLVRSLPTEPLLNGLVLAPELHVRQRADGALLAGSDFGGALPGDDAEATARKLFAKVQDLLVGGERLRFGGYTVGVRPNPPDGVSAVGRLIGVEGLYVCATHSGMLPDSTRSAAHLARTSFMMGSPQPVVDAAALSLLA